MARTSLGSLLLASALALSACQSSPPDEEIPFPEAQEACDPNSDAPQPEDCGDLLEEEPLASPPSTSAEIEPLLLPPADDELARAGNDEDPSRTTFTTRVTVAAGARLRSTVACAGTGVVTLETTPESGAEQELTCEYDGPPVELIVEDGVESSTPRTYDVSVTATAPSRWAVVLSSTDEPI